jgi:hypothetical protein
MLNIFICLFAHVQLIGFKKFNASVNHIKIVSAIGLRVDVVLELTIMSFSKKL